MSQTTYFKGALVLPDRVVEHGLLAVQGGLITGVWDLETETGPHADPASIIEGAHICPGFIDIHVHGGGGADFMDGDPDGVATITQTHARYGTTGLLATTLTASEAEILAALRAVKAAPKRGAQILGFHIEGPFINPKMKGAQDERHVRLASVTEIESWLQLGEPDDRWHITLAPEQLGAIPAIRHLVKRGAVVSAGHTDCTCAQLAQAAHAGLSHVTHLYNAMRGLHHREPGTVGGALTIDGLTVELIADSIHVDPTAMQVAIRARGIDSIILITDAMRAAGLGDGEYLLGALPTTVKGGEARLADGTLAGSVLTMDRAVKNMVELCGVPLHQAVAMASLNPARRHELDQFRGSLSPGKRADIAVLEQDLTCSLTMVGGQIVHDGR